MKALKKILAIILVILVCAAAVGLILFRSPAEFASWVDDMFLSAQTLPEAGDSLLTYEQLTKKEQQAYSSLVNAMNAFEDDVYVGLDGVDEVKRVYYAVLQDNPQIFWVGNISVMSSKMFSKTIYTKVLIEYSYTKEQVSELTPIIEEYAQNCFSSLPDGEYEKALYLHDYIINNTDYDLDSADNQNIISVFVNGSSVCSGYARALQYLYQRAGIPCVYVSGSMIQTGENHAWNVALLEGEYYHVDVTWDDPVYMSGENLSEAEHNYFMVTTDEILTTHMLSEEYPYVLPDCVSTDCCYFNREGLYFNDYSYDDCYSAIKKAVDGGKSSISFKFGGASAMQTAQYALINGYDSHKMINRAYGVAEGAGRSVYYVSDDSLNILKIRWK